MADQVMTAGTELSALRPEVWSAAFYPTLLEALPFNDSVARNYEGEIRALGNIVNITSFPQFGEAQSVLESQRVDADSITATGTQLTINELIVKDFIITDVAQIQTLEAANAIRDLAFHSIMKKMQSLIIADVSPSSSTPDHTIGYDAGTTLALADILEAKELLDDQDVEAEGRVMILGSAQSNDIFNVTGFTSRDFLGSGEAPLASGMVPGRVLGFTPRMTTEAGSTAYFFHPLFMQVAVQMGLTTKVYDQGVDGKRSYRVNNSLLMGDVQVSNLRVVTIS